MIGTSVSEDGLIEFPDDLVGGVHNHIDMVRIAVDTGETESQMQLEAFSLTQLIFHSFLWVSINMEYIMMNSEHSVLKILLAFAFFPRKSMNN